MRSIPLHASVRSLLVAHRVFNQRLCANRVSLCAERDGRMARKKRVVDSRSTGAWKPNANSAVPTARHGREWVETRADLTERTPLIHFYFRISPSVLASLVISPGSIRLHWLTDFYVTLRQTRPLLKTASGPNNRGSFLPRSNRFACRMSTTGEHLMGYTCIKNMFWGCFSGNFLRQTFWIKHFLVFSLHFYWHLNKLYEFLLTEMLHITDYIYYPVRGTRLKGRCSTVTTIRCSSEIETSNVISFYSHSWKYN